MIVSDLVRAVVALGFILTIHRTDTWLLYLLSGTADVRVAVFHQRARRDSARPSPPSEELHTANSLTQTTQWTTLAIGSFLGGAVVTQFGYQLAFVFNSLSFLFSALCISRLFAARPAVSAPPRASLTEDRSRAPLARIRRRPALHARRRR